MDGPEALHAFIRAGEIEEIAHLLPQIDEENSSTSENRNDSNDADGPRLKRIKFDLNPTFIYANEADNPMNQKFHNSNNNNSGGIPSLLNLNIAPPIEDEFGDRDDRFNTNGGPKSNIPSPWIHNFNNPPRNPWQTTMASGPNGSNLNNNGGGGNSNNSSRSDSFRNRSDESHGGGGSGRSRRNENRDRDRDRDRDRNRENRTNSGGSSRGWSNRRN